MSTKEHKLLFKKNQNHQNRRIMTSAIDSMSVAEVRKFLGECRRKYQIQTIDDPMYITDKLPNGMQLQEFALKFQQGHHQKRHNKVRKSNVDGTSSDEDDDDYYDTFNSSGNESEDDFHGSTTQQRFTESTQNKLILSNQTNTPPHSSNENSSISNDITTVLVKKRGRPKKNTSPTTDNFVSVHPSTPPPVNKKQKHAKNQEHKTEQIHTENRSRSLLDYVQKPSKRPKQ
jgi:hypothetical protein